jgi:hypothetical protein
MLSIKTFATRLRRIHHHAVVDFRVWRQNREVADAFRDPMLEGPGVLSLSAVRLRAPRAAWAFAGLSLALAAGFALRGGSRPEPVSLPRIPGAERPGSLLTSPSPRQAEGVNTAILRVAAGLEYEGDAGPAPVAAMPERYTALIACKRDRTLHVYERRGPGTWSRLGGYPIAFGPKEGDKSDAGDRRTPEGLYWITSILSGPSQGVQYGPLVLTLNYPTPRDLAEGKSGEGIWIHGVEAGKHPTVTRGCLALENRDILQLAAQAGPGTPIVILPEGHLPDPALHLDERDMAREYPALIAEHGRRDAAEKKAGLLAEARAWLEKEAREHPAAPDTLTQADREAILARLEGWRGDWMGRDAEAFAKHYAADFRDRQGRDRKSFLERKRRIFASKTRITMEMDGVEIGPDGRGGASVTFRQEYAAEGGGDGLQRSSGRKSVSLGRSPEGWLITGE